MLPSLDEIPKKRKMLNLTQKQLASLAGVSQSLIAKLESKKINPSYDRVKAIFDTIERLEIKTDVRALEVVHEEVVGIQKEDPVSKAVRRMTEYGYSQLPVFQGDHAIGSISERTVLEQVSEGRDLAEISKLRVGEMMEEAFPTVGEEVPLPVISSLLQVYSAVLISKKGKVVGIITKADLLKMFL